VVEFVCFGLFGFFGKYVVCLVCLGLFDSKTALELKIWLFFLPW